MSRRLPSLFLVPVLLSVLAWPAGGLAEDPEAAQFDCVALYGSGEYRGAALCFDQLLEQGNHLSLIHI